MCDGLLCDALVVSWLSFIEKSRGMMRKSIKKWRKLALGRARLETQRRWPSTAPLVLCFPVGWIPTLSSHTRSVPLTVIGSIFYSSLPPFP